jgi:uncharacterized protein (TIGR00255 family)
MASDVDPTTKNMKPLRTNVMSMTGYGAATIDLGEGKGRLQVTVRSVNHRNLDLRFRLATDIGALEMVMRKSIQERLRRGHVDVSLQRDRSVQTESVVRVDEGLAKQLGSALERLNDVSGVDAVIDPVTVARFPGVLTVESTHDTTLDEGHEEQLRAGLAQALDALVTMRAAEGSGIADELAMRVATIQSLGKQIEESGPQLVAAHRERLRERIAELTEQPLDEGRLEHEVALLADKADVAEELSRIQSHCDQFTAELANEPSASGKKLEFITQELLRELNTIGSKSPDTQIRALVIEGKSELERIREQLANVE